MPLSPQTNMLICHQINIKRWACLKGALGTDYEETGQEEVSDHFEDDVVFAFFDYFYLWYLEWCQLDWVNNLLLMWIMLRQLCPRVELSPKFLTPDIVGIRYWIKSSFLNCARESVSLWSLSLYVHECFGMSIKYTCCRRASYSGQLALLDAHRRKLVLVIQTHRTGSEFVLWNDFAFNGPAVFRVAWVETGEGGRQIIRADRPLYLTQADHVLHINWVNI